MSDFNADDFVKKASGERRHTASKCQTMPEIRHEIDRLDRALVALLKERLTYIERAGIIKPTRDVVRDEARIEDVVSKVLVEAKALGLPKEIADPVWRLLIEKCIAHEFVIYDADEAANAPQAAAGN
ncbi:MAG: chorismate mutase [Alphaproteobacteria bacterium]|nr:MAG: chorismate mutase [Alphaproteobacteria bacterium]